MGLGNPGPRYEATRHNVGFRVVAACAHEASVSFSSFKSHGVMASITLQEGVTVRLGAPSSFMNRSGTPVAAMSTFYKIPPSQLVIVHDELDLAPGVVRLKFGGGLAGHNGLKDIARMLGTSDFYRVRVGIGRPEGQRPVADYVLDTFSAQEEADLGHTLALACHGIEALVTTGLTSAQTTIHPLS